MSQFIAFIRKLFLLTFLCTLFSCASSKQFKQQLNNQVDLGKYKDGISFIETNREREYGKSNQLVYLMNLAMLFHLNGDFEKSNQFCRKAEALVSDLFTKSISKKTASFLINDMTEPYEGENFEKVFLNTLSALNYLMLNDLESALVEGRKVDLKLSKFTREIKDKNKYREDAFSRYLAGMLYEADGEENDALISYRKSYLSYKNHYSKFYGTSVPEALKEALVRTSKLNEFEDEYQKYVAEFGSAFENKVSEFNQKAHLIVFVQTDTLPLKVEKKWFVNYEVAKNDMRVVKVAYPEFEKKKARVAGLSLELEDDNGKRNYLGSKVQPLALIARKDLNDRIAGIKAKAIARAIAKFLAQVQAEKHSKAGGIFLNIFNVLTENADTRSWHTLPANIYMLQADINPGKYDATINIFGPAGRVLDRIDLGEISLFKGQWKFVVKRNKF